MALYLTVQKNAPHGEKTEVVWHVGAPRFDCGPDETVIEVQADGDELDFIKLSFDNIYHRIGKRVVLWRGETAQFIADNL